MSKDASERYCKKNCVGLYLKLNRKTDADILAWLDALPNKQGYIKVLIRHDIDLMKLR